MGKLSGKRKGRVTASAIGAILGVNPYQSKADVLRRMVRDHFGAEPEFKGNAATQYGHDHEMVAIQDYEIQYDKEVQTDPEFETLTGFDWIGCTPDGLIDDDGLIEVKCPYGKKLYTLDNKLYYKYQCYLQLVVTERQYLDFYVWTPNEQHKETLSYIDAVEWFNEHFDEIQAFYQEYLDTIEDEKKAKPHLEPLELDLSDDQKWIGAASTYQAAKEDFEASKAALDDAKAALLAIAKDKGKKCTGGGVMAYKLVRKGNVQYKNIPELKGVDLEQYRAKSSTIWTVK